MLIVLRPRENTRPSLTQACETSANGSSTDESRALGKPLPACLKSSRGRRNARPAAVNYFWVFQAVIPKPDLLEVASQQDPPPPMVRTEITQSLFF